MRGRTILCAAILAIAGAPSAQIQLVVPLTQNAPMALCPGGATSKQPEPTSEEKAAREFCQTVVQGKELADRVERVLEELDWHFRLDGAVKAASESGRPILWIQALGDLRAYT